MIKMLKNQENVSNDWINGFFEDFKRRFLALLSFEFKILPVNLCLNIMDPRLTTKDDEENNLNSIKKDEMLNLINLYDLKRMESYGKNLVDYHLILDLLPTLAKLFYL
jgi:N-acetyltransferase 10